MFYLLIPVFIIGLIFIPQWWVKYIFNLYSQPSEEFPGKGAELAEHFLSLFDLQSVKVQPTPRGDHYNPEDQTLNLSPTYYDGKSLTTMVIVAHEIGHVIQQKENNPWFRLRYRLATFTIKLEKLSSIAILLIPVFTVVFKTPAVVFPLLMVGFSGMLFNILVPERTFTLHFGGCEDGRINCMPITPDWTSSASSVPSAPFMARAKQIIPGMMKIKTGRSFRRAAKMLPRRASRSFGAPRVRCTMY